MTCHAPKDTTNAPDILSALADTSGPVVFFPVRHHSPAAAHCVRELARTLRPTALLIEGPSDYNERLDELRLPHTLPIAIYSYFRLADERRSGAFYPLCVYSPEWQALQVAVEIGARAAFIDLPWADLLLTAPLVPARAGEAADEPFPSVPEADRVPPAVLATAPGMPPAPEAVPNRYADGELRVNGYVETLCRSLGIEDFDTLWDTLFEIDPDLTPSEYLLRCHAFCYHSRILAPYLDESDIRREAYMAARIAATLAAGHDKILVVTGGFHAAALWSRLNDPAFLHWEFERHGFARPEFPLVSSREEQAGDPDPVLTTNGKRSACPEQAETGNILPDLAKEGSDAGSQTGPEMERGVALTPYSYARLDSLTGYESGMPSPGFYHHVWNARQGGNASGGRNAIAGPPHRQLLADTVTMLRRRGQTASAADLIAVEATARALASLRGHATVWRRDLMDGITGALVKDEIEPGRTHPFLNALYAVFRGEARGQLADGTALPPLVHDMRRLLEAENLEPQPRDRLADIDLGTPEGLRRSRLLHRLRLLAIAGFEKTGGTDFVRRDDMAWLSERWRIRWTPETDSSAIEAAIYGASVIEGAQARLLETARKPGQNSESAALLLLDASLAGLPDLSAPLFAQLEAEVRGEGDFFRLTRALGHLLYLYRYDDALGTTGRGDIGAILREAFGRGLWLLESLNPPVGQAKELLTAFRALLETWERCGAGLRLKRDAFVGALRRMLSDRTQTPLLRGAASGTLWTLNEVPLDDVLGELQYCADASRLGDFLTGLFALAREAVQRHAGLLQNIDGLLLGYDEEGFLEVLPGLRLAFSHFTPREKNVLARTLLQAASEPGAEVAPDSALLPALVVSPEIAAQAHALETRLFRILERYGVRL